MARHLRLTITNNYSTVFMNLSMKLQSGVAAIALVALAAGTTGCEPNAGSGALTGAALGAGIGAIAGNDGGDIAKGAAIGAAAGGIAGAIIKARRYQGAGGQPGSPGYYDYPVARWHSQGTVISPYSGKLVDVTGFRSGELAVDPTANGQVFRVP